jgi:hypothetical protein
MTAVGACKSWGASKEDFLRARCEVDGLGRDCRVADLSASGLFVESFVPATVGKKVNVSVRLPNGHQVSAAGVVSHHEFRVGFGVHFTDLSSRDREQIAGLVG